MSTGGAAEALKKLREEMADIREPHPAFMPGFDLEPTAADNCRELLDLADYCIQQLARYLNIPSTNPLPPKAPPN